MQSHSLLPLISLLLLLLLSLTFFSPSSCAVYPLSTSGGLGHRFDGIGALSGGGCTSRLLVDYPEPSRSHILDYLFTPGFGASLHILKVEIGGDAQSTEGTEPSHMHTETDISYERGYQWWLMKEAKRRNPAILLSALPWAFPQWVSEGTRSPFTNSTVRYVLAYLRGALTAHNLTIDYVGVWNERGYTADYVIALSAALRASGLPTRLVAHDTSWDICAPLAANPALHAAVDIVGAHYPGTQSDAVCSGLGKPLWSSEDYAETWNGGGGCMARVLNQNYVRGNMTATIAWNLVASYYDELAYARM